MSRPFVKVCGITTAADARAAVAAGAEAIGFVLHPASPRYISPKAAARITHALPAGIARVGVVVDLDVDVVRSAVEVIRLTAVQAHGDETPEECLAYGAPVIKALRTPPGWDPAEAEPWRHRPILLDGYRSDQPGGTGRLADWDAARGLVEAGYRVLLAGGLGPENVFEAARTVGPVAVDLNSGVELVPGRKDEARIREAMERLGPLGPPDRRMWPW